MKKFKKILALITGAAMAVPMAGSLQADASENVWGYITEIGAQEGYEFFDDKGLFDYTTYPSGKPATYLIYYLPDGQKSMYGTDLRVYSDPTYNRVWLTLESPEDISKVYEIYDKYKEELDMDSFVEYPPKNTSGDYRILLMDMYDDDGNRTFDRSSIPNKSKTFQTMINEMYENGLLKYASYTPMMIFYESGYFDKINNSSEETYNDFEFNLSDLEATADELYKTLSNVSTELKVESKVVMTDDEENKTVLNISGIKDDQELINVFSKVMEVYPDAVIDHNIAITVLETASETYEADTINLLDPYICDIDGNGNADVTDATHILSTYAESAAGIQKLSDDNSMDVNGDGTVDLQDATYVLTYYAEAAAGLR